MKNYQEVVDATARSSKHLLLGNGFSIACDPVFSYGSLFQRAVRAGLPARAQAVFQRLGTNNFEGVMRVLEDTDWIAREYGLISSDESDLIADLRLVRDTLAGAIADSHLEYPSKVPEEKYKAFATFVSGYSNVFTINYDLLAYWADMNDSVQVKYQDGFRPDIDNPTGEYLVFAEHVGRNPGLFYLHGALHLYQEHGQVRKHSWRRSNRRLVELVRNGISHNQYPLFVAEGTAGKKLEQIQSNGYLSYCLSKLCRVKNAIVMIGCSLADNDWHIYKAIAQNTEFSTVFIGIYDKPSSPGFIQIEKTAQRMRDRRMETIEATGKGSELQVELFDSATAPVWG